MSYRIRVATGSKPMRVILRQAEDPVPMEMDLVVASETGLTGSLDIGRFEVDVLKKPTIVDYFDFRFKPNEPPGLAGRIIVEQAEYDIHLTFFGTTAAPRVEVTSVPPRPESEIMANLLYGQSLDDLDPERQRSVAETRAAFAEGAIGLISMFYLASTPIESIGYNPHTGEFHARVKVREGLALEVGSDFEGQRRVGLSKRLGGNWSFETYALTSDSKDGDGSRGVAMLRWARRY